MPLSLTRTASGLILSEDFASLASWSVAGAWISAADPSLVVFDPSNVGGLTGPPDAAEIFGCRQGTVFVEGGTWYDVHDGWDGTTPIIQRLATSTDQGLTWTKQSGSLVGTANGSGGNWSGLATGWIAKWGSTYYLYRVIQSGGGSFPLNASGPYFGDIWTASSLSTSATWTFVRQLPLPASTWASGEHLPGSVLHDGSTYHLYAQGSSGGGIYVIGRSSATDPGGPWTLDSTVIADTIRLGASRHPENPKGFYHAGLGRYCILSNLIQPDGSATDQNLLLLSTAPDDWSAATMHRIQHTSPLDSPGAVGVMTHFTGPDGALIVEADGSMPVVFDGLGTSAPGYHLGRTIRYAVLEPSATCARYSDNNTNRMTRTVAHTDIVAEFACEFRSIDAGAGLLAFEFRRQDSVNYYRLVLTPGAGMRLDKVVAGTPTTIQTAISSTQTAYAGVVHRVRLVASGTAIDAYLNGEHQIGTTDATYSSGVSVGLLAANLDGDIRRFHLRTSQTVTIANLGSGTPVTIRGAGGVPLVAGSGSAITPVPHSPAVSIQVGTQTFTPPGGVWGGDVYQLASGPETIGLSFL